MLLGTRVGDVEMFQQDMAVLLSFYAVYTQSYDLSLLFWFKFAFSTHFLLVAEPQSTKEKMVYANVS